MQRNRKIKPLIRGISCRGFTRYKDANLTTGRSLSTSLLCQMDTGRTIRGSPILLLRLLGGDSEGYKYCVAGLTGLYWLGSPSSVQHLFIYYARVTVTRTPMTMPLTRSSFSPPSSALGDDSRLNNKELGVPECNRGAWRNGFLQLSKWKFCIGKF